MQLREIVRRFAVLSTGALVLVSTAVFAVLPCPYSQPLGLIGYATSVGNHALGIDVQGNYAYVGDWNQGSYHAYAGVFQVFDVSDSCNPVRLPGWVETISPGYNEIGDLAVHENRAYLANDANGFAVYDISDPSSPVLLNQRNDATYAHSVFYQGGTYAYVGYGWSTNKELAIYDVSTLPLAAPTIYPTGTGGVHDAYVAGDRAYVLCGERLDVVDVANPLSPSGISSLALPQSQYGVEGEVRVQGAYAFLAMGDAGHVGGLRIIDISHDTNPTLVASYDIPGGAGKMYAKGIGLAVAGDRAYIAAKGGLWVFDVSSPSSPALVANYPLPTDFVNSMGAHVEVRDQLAYVTAYGLTTNDSIGGLAIYKIANIPYTVQIDIKPGSFPNCFNINGHGVIPVAILGSEDFDVSDVNTESLLFAGMEVRVRGNKGPLCSTEDVNGDSYPDLVCHFEDQPENWAGGDDTATLQGELNDGAIIEGHDSICIVP